MRSQNGCHSLGSEVVHGCFHPYSTGQSNLQSQVQYHWLEQSNAPHIYHNPPNPQHNVHREGYEYLCSIEYETRRHSCHICAVVLRWNIGLSYCISHPNHSSVGYFLCLCDLVTTCSYAIGKTRVILPSFRE